MFGMMQDEKPSFPRECTRYNYSGCDASTCDPVGIIRRVLIRGSGHCFRSSTNSFEPARPSFRS